MLHFQPTEKKEGSLCLLTDQGTGSWLGPTVRVKGDISGNGDLLICGSVEGTIKLEGRLTIGPLANINAEISARDIVTQGFVKGDVRTTGRIEIKKDGSVIGNLTAAQIIIDDGADFRGSVEIEPTLAKEKNMKDSLQRVSTAAGGA